MDTTQLFRRAANIVWQHKFLILLGILAAFSSGSASDGFRFNLDGNGGYQNGQPGAMPWGNDLPQIVAPFWPRLREMGDALPAGALLLACLALAVGLVLYVLGTIARGGLISAVDALEEGHKTSFSTAWNAAWQRGWTLVGIGLLPAVPALIGFLLGLLGLAGYAGIRSVSPDVSVPNLGFGGLVGLLTCILLPVSLVLGLLRTFANRAAMLEGVGVIEAYRRGFAVLRDNVGSALLIFIVQIVISVLLALFLILPGLIVALCCLLWPLLFLFQGFMAAFFSAVWTLAWRQWTATPFVGKMVA